MKGRVKYVLTAKLETLTTNENGKLWKNESFQCILIFIFIYE